MSRHVFTAVALVLLASVSGAAEHHLLSGLTHALKSSDLEVQRYALEKITQLGLAREFTDDAKFQTLLRTHVDSRDQDEVEAALEAIGALGPDADKALVDAVVTLAKSDRRFAQSVTTALAKLEMHPAARRQLDALLRGGDAYLQLNTLAAVAECGALSATEIAQLVGDPGNDRYRVNRRQLALVIGTYGTAAADQADLLIKYALESPPSLRPGELFSDGPDPFPDYARALAALGPTVVPRLEAVVVDAGAVVRAWVVDALVAIGDPAEEALLRLLNDGTPDQRTAVCRALISRPFKPLSRLTIRDELLELLVPEDDSGPEAGSSATELEAFLLSDFPWRSDVAWIARQQIDLPELPAVASLSPRLKQATLKALNDLSLRQVEDDEQGEDRLDFANCLVGIAACGQKECPEALTRLLAGTKFPPVPISPEVQSSGSEPESPMASDDSLPPKPSPKPMVLQSDVLLATTLFTTSAEFGLKLANGYLYASSADGSSADVPAPPSENLILYVVARDFSLVARIVANGGRNMVEQLKPMVMSDDFEERKLAHLSLGLLGVEASDAAPMMIEALQQEVTFVTKVSKVVSTENLPYKANLRFGRLRTLIWVVAQMSGSTTDRLLDLAQGSEPDLLRWSAIAALGETPADARVDRALNAILSTDESAAIVAAVALAHRNDIRSAVKLTELIRSDSPNMVQIASRAVEQLGTDARDAATDLVKLIVEADQRRDTNDTATNASWRAVAEIGVVTEPGIELLQTAIDNIRLREEDQSDENSRYEVQSYNNLMKQRLRTATEVIENSTDSPAVALAAMLDHREGVVRAHVRRRLESLTDRSALDLASAIALLEAALRFESDRSGSRLRFYAYLADPSNDEQTEFAAPGKAPSREEFFELVAQFGSPLRAWRDNSTLR